jgi:hypothetical protein
MARSPGSSNAVGDKTNAVIARSGRRRRVRVAHNAIRGNLDLEQNNRTRQ